MCMVTSPCLARAWNLPIQSFTIQHGLNSCAPAQVINRDSSTGAATLLFRVAVDRGMPWQDALSLLQEHCLPAAASGAAEVQQLEAKAPTEPLMHSQGADRMESEPEVVILDGREDGAWTVRCKACCSQKRLLSVQM